MAKRLKIYASRCMILVLLGLMGFFLPAALGHWIFTQINGTGNASGLRDGVDCRPSIPQPTTAVVENKEAK